MGAIKFILEFFVYLICFLSGLALLGFLVSIFPEYKEAIEFFLAIIIFTLAFTVIARNSRM